MWSDDDKCQNHKKDEVLKMMMKCWKWCIRNNDDENDEAIKMITNENDDDGYEEWWWAWNYNKTKWW
jgi:hypothetical protein